MDARVSAYQKGSVLDRFRLIKASRKERKSFPKAPYIRALEEHRPFEVVRVKSAKRD